MRVCDSGHCRLPQMGRKWWWSWWVPELAAWWMHFLTHQATNTAGHSDKEKPESGHGCSAHRKSCPEPMAWCLFCLSQKLCLPHGIGGEVVHLVGSAQMWVFPFAGLVLSMWFCPRQLAVAASICSVHCFPPHTSHFFFCFCFVFVFFSFLQEGVINMENADFGLKVSRINKDSGEETVHPRRVSGTQEADSKKGIPLPFIIENSKHCFLSNEKVKMWQEKAGCDEWASGAAASLPLGTYASPVRAPIWVPAAPPPVLLPANVHQEAKERDSSVPASATHMVDQMEFWVPGVPLAPAQPWLLWTFGEWNRPKQKLYVCVFTFQTRK